MKKASPERLHRDPARVDAIMNVAWQTFLEDGYSGASMSRISEHLGGSKSTLYNYFSSKEEIFRSVVSHKGRELYEDIQNVLLRNGDISEDLAEYARCICDVIVSDRYIALHRLVISEAVRFPGAGGPVFDERRIQVLGPLARRLAYEMAAGRLADADPLEAAETFWNLCTATLHRRVLAGMTPHVAGAEAKAAIPRAVGLFLRAFRV